MEVSGVILGSLPCIPCVGGGAGIDHSKSLCFSSTCFFPGVSTSCSGACFSKEFRHRKFHDNSHLMYYYYTGRLKSSSEIVRCGSSYGKKAEGMGKVKEISNSAAKKATKRKLKLLKDLSENLVSFSGMSFGLQSNDELVDQVKGKMISESAALLLGQLEQLRASEEEMKQKRKEVKAKLKAARKQNKKLGLEMSTSSSSSSSSSESSSDSECGELVDLSRLRCEAISLPLGTEFQAAEAEATVIVPTLPNYPGQDTSPTEAVSVPTLPSATSSVDISCNDDGSSRGPVIGKESAAAGGGRIEVCMGGKCKKSGAASLLEEFRRMMVGAEDAAAVVGCKCMGKCRSGPNVRVLNSSSSGMAEEVADSVRNPINPLCIGVGLEDVGLIVANFLGGSHNKDIGLAATS